MLRQPPWLTAQGRWSDDLLARGPLPVIDPGGPDIQFLCIQEVFPLLSLSLQYNACWRTKSSCPTRHHKICGCWRQG